MNVQITKEIIFEYLNGNVTALQRKQIERWIQLENNEELFYQYIDEWEKVHLQYSPSIDDAIMKYQQFVNNSSDEKEIQEPFKKLEYIGKQSSWYSILIASAMSLLVLCVNADTERYITLKAPLNTIVEYELEDRSKVVLEPGSMIVFKQNWIHKEERIIWLKGKGKFVVNHLKDHKKFIVKAENNIDISVLGTIFLVTTSLKKTEVYLEEGSIELNKNAGSIRHQMAMKPGDRIIADRKGFQKTPYINTDEEKRDSLREHRFNFNQTSLQEITELLETTYRIKSTILDPELASLTLSGSFKATHYLELVSSLAEVLNIHFEVENDQSITFY